MSKQQTGGFRDSIISLVGIFMLLAFSRYASQIVVPFLLALVQFRSRQIRSGHSVVLDNQHGHWQRCRTKGDG
jgi:hypothetical protein